MRLTDILKPENIKLPLVATEKEAAIEELVQLLADNGELENPSRVRQAILEREATRSTGIGDGLAVPHGKTEGVDHLTMAFGRAKEPIDFEAVDGKPVSLVWLVSSPIDKTGPHLNALARISKIMTDAGTRKKLLSAGTAQEIYSIISTQDDMP